MSRSYSLLYAGLVFSIVTLLATAVVADAEPAAGSPNGKVSAVESEAALDPHDLRTKTEWVGLRGGVGLGFNASLQLFTLRWPYFYWEIARAALSGGVAAEGFALAWGGTTIGFPWHLGDLGRHEIRIGVSTGVGVGYTYASVIQNDNEADQLQDRGVDPELVPWWVFGPELYYVFHYAEYGAFVAGLELYYAPSNGDWAPNVCFASFFGIAI
jgi:hypothetical protein